MQYRYPLCWQSKRDADGNKVIVPQLHWEPIEIEVPEVSSLDAPVVLETEDIKIRWHDSSHWYPFTPSTAKYMPDTRGRTHAELLRFASETGDYGEVLTLKKSPLVSTGMWAAGAGDDIPRYRIPPKKVSPGTGKGDTARQEAVEEMQRAARNTVLIDGFLWTRGGPPVLAAWRKMPELNKQARVNFIIQNIDTLCGEKNQKFFRKEWLMFSPQTSARTVTVECKRRWPELRGKDFIVPPIKVYQPEMLRKNIELIELKSQVAAAIGDWWAASVLSQATEENSYGTPDWRQIDSKSLSLLLELKDSLEKTHRDPNEENITSLKINADIFAREAYPKGALEALPLTLALDRWTEQPENLYRPQSEAS